MARENQGLQIALIAFVVLTILFSVTTFIFFRQAKEATIRADKAESMAKDNQTAANNIQTEYNKVKQMVGFADSDRLDTINRDYNQDMETYAGNFEAENRVYRKVLVYLNDIIQKKNAALAAEQEQVKALTAAMASFEQVKQPQIDQAFQTATKASSDLKAQRAVFDQELKDTKENNNQLLTKLEKSRKDAEATVEKSQTKQKELEDQIRLVMDQYHFTRDKLEKMIEPTFEAADGEVRWVDQRDKTVWINLGRADALKRRTTFSVYSSDTNDVTKAGRKGSIEVTQVLGEHMSEARIVEDQVSNPIMPGDVIHTPVWAPNSREHFALVGFLDIDGDGKSDKELVKDLIASNGAVIDAEVDAKGKRIGKMTAETRYLVRGEQPAVDASPEMQSVYSEMGREAERLGISIIDLPTLLQRMGYKNENRIVRFGKHPDRKQFPARLPEGEVPRVSSGEVSGLYMDKQPPRATRGSAY